MSLFDGWTVTLETTVIGWSWRVVHRAAPGGTDAVVGTGWRLTRRAALRRAVAVTRAEFDRLDPEGRYRLGARDNTIHTLTVDELLDMADGLHPIPPKETP